MMTKTQAVVKQIRKLLDEKEWCYHVEDGRVIVTMFSGRDAHFRVAIHVFSDPLQVLIVVRFPLIAPADRREALSELIGRISNGILPGQFWLDMDEGDLNCVGVIPLVDAELRAGQFNFVFDGTLERCDEWFRPIARLTFDRDISPYQAIAEAEMAKKK